MATVTKAMTVAELKEQLAPLETSTGEVFSPHIEGRFELAHRGDAERVQFLLGDRRFEVTGDAYLRVCRTVGIPANYAARTPTDMIIPHLNYWLENTRKPEYTVGIAERNGALTAVYFNDSGAAAPSALQIVEIAEELEGPLEASYVSVTPARTMFKLSTPRREGEVRVGDVVRGGVSVDMAYDASRLTEIASYIERLVCTNGMIASDYLFRAPRKDAVDAEWVRDVTSQAFSALDAQLTRLQQLNEIPLSGHLGDSATSVFEEFGVPASMRERVTLQLLEIADPTAYDLLNAVTWVASNDPEVALQPSASYRLMQIGGALAAHPQFCGECHRVRS